VDTGETTCFGGYGGALSLLNGDETLYLRPGYISGSSFIDGDGKHIKRKVWEALK
jgi:hypothetical protein